MHTERQGTEGSQTKRGRTLTRLSINTGTAMLQECEVVASSTKVQTGTHALYDPLLAIHFERDRAIVR